MEGRRKAVTAEVITSINIFKVYYIHPATLTYMTILVLW